ncbi:hypothetical protein BJV78DRAFT_1286703 [Lactifluus subvellereus]|nr:hypothetical protein BJV78DRAFT_1286703 [Lactifluus subvellereus]
MSQAAHEVINAGIISGEGIYTTGHHNVPQSAQNQTSQGQSSFSDGSGPLFNVYVKMAEEEDNKIADRWQKDADGILIFTGLFPAAVAALAAVSIQDIEAADSARLPRATWVTLEDIVGRGVDGVLQSVEAGHSSGSRGNNNNEGSSLCAQGIVAGMIASVPVEERDYRWKALIMDHWQPGVMEGVVRDFLTHGDSALIANLIYITRQIFRSYLDGDHFILYALSYILPAISGCDIQHTLPGLQNDFCAL